MSKSRRTKACTFDKGTIARIIRRDGDTCIFCASGRWPLVKKDFGAHIRDIAHGPEAEAALNEYIDSHDW